MRWKQYVEQVAKIRILSSPEVNSSMSAMNYFEVLNQNFTKIRELAVSNREILAQDIYPFFEHKDELLSDEIVEEFRQMSESLVDAYNMENLDMIMTAQIADRLYIDAEAKGDIHYIIEQLDALIEAYYTLLNMTKRIQKHSSMCDYYRNRAIEVSKILMKYYDKDEFIKLPDEESKETVLINSRYISMLHEGQTGEKSKKAEWEILSRALDLENDSFYREQVPNYDWIYHRARTLEYFAYMLELHNQKGLTVEESGMVAGYCEELYELWQTNEAVKEYVTEAEINLFLCRAKFFSNQIGISEYKKLLLKIYEGRKSNQYAIGDIMENILIPVEYMMAIKDGAIVEEDMFILESIYMNVISYVTGMPNTGSLCYMLEYFSEFMANYIEIPGQSDYIEVCLNAMAALHPPTYVHSNMVARLSKCMCRHFLNNEPELFVGTLGYEDLKSVLDNRDRIENFIYSGALCHDVGKIWIMDTIFVYGRNLTDDEFTLVKTHPIVGSDMLGLYDSTKGYQDMALGHHKWHDDSRGYPVSFDTRESKSKFLVDILACADCLDAATDSVGRSYNTKKTIEEVLNELAGESGSRYNPAIKSLFEDDKVVGDLKYLLADGRKQMYLNTFRRLLAAKTAAYGSE